MASLELYEQAYPNDAHRTIDRVHQDGTGGWDHPDDALLPRPFGYNVIDLGSPDPGPARLAVRADAEGHRGTASRMVATLVLRDGNETQYHPLLDAGDQAVLELELGEIDEGYHDYQVVLTELEGPPRDDERSSGLPPEVACGCAVGTGRAGGLLLTILPIAMVVRRRGDRRAPGALRP